MDNMELWNSWKEVPQEAKKPITGGRLKGMTDINPMWRYRVLTEKFGCCGDGWYVDDVHYNVFPGADGEQVVTCELKLHILLGDGVYSQGIIGQGGSMLVEKEKSGMHTNDEAFKMAFTDAVSVACKQLGIGADVYWSGNNNSKYPTKPVMMNTDDDPLGNSTNQCEVCGAPLSPAVYKATKAQFGKAMCEKCRGAK